MELVIGVILASSTVISAKVVGFDRERAFFPVLLMVIASYYVLFAVMGNSSTSLLPEVALATIFAGVSIAGYRRSLWFVVAGLVVHGIFDLLHSALIVNPGMPLFWPSFCAAFDIVLAGYLTSLLVRGHTLSKPC